MRNLVYHVAMTLDGCIAKSDDSVPGFASDGPHVDDYKASLASYEALVMGRGTYEIGYPYGMKPGDKPYRGQTALCLFGFTARS
jgi:dihydrofolate reductase